MLDWYSAPWMTKRPITLLGERPESMLQRPYLLHLPLELFEDVVQMLYEDDLDNRASFNSLRLVCKTMRNRSEKFFFRTITIHDRCQIPEANSVNIDVLERMRNPEDIMSTWVRTVKVGRCDRDSTFPCGAEFVKSLRCASNLEFFWWNTWFPMPQLVYDHIHSRPCIRLGVCTLRGSSYRGSSYAHNCVAMDAKILSSPQLHTLSYFYFYSESGRSEYPALMRCLSKAVNLKSLRLQNKRIPTDYPNFEETSNFDLTSSHWNKLTKLDLTPDIPIHLLSALTGRVPQLQTLVVSFHGLDRMFLIRFLEAIDGLKNVYIRQSHQSQEGQFLLEALLNKHGQSLQQLSLEVGLGGNLYAEICTLQKRRLPSLVSLRVDLASSDSSNVGMDPHTGEPWRYPWMSEMSTDFPSLRDITVCLATYSPQFGIGARNLDEAAGARTAIALFEYWADRAPRGLEKATLILRPLIPNSYGRWILTAQKKWNVKKGADVINVKISVS